MSNKTYPLGSSEAMKYEPRLDEEYYLDRMDNTLAKLKVNIQELKDSYLEDSINEQYDDIDCHPNYNPATDSIEA